jgi:hypothetical protein
MADKPDTLKYTREKRNTQRKRWATIKVSTTEHQKGKAKGKQ